MGSLIFVCELPELWALSVLLWFILIVSDLLQGDASAVIRIVWSSACRLRVLRVKTY